MDSYSQLHPDSKVWVYQGDRKMNPYEVLGVRQKLQKFVEVWSSHGADVKAFGDIYNNLFLVLFADETQAGVSGCSIDSSVHFIKNLESDLNIDFFNRLLIAYKKGEEIEIVPREKFQSLIESGAVDESTIVFNNMITSKAEFENSWEVPLKDSWHSRFLPQ